MSILKNKIVLLAVVAASFLPTAHGEVPYTMTGALNPAIRTLRLSLVDSAGNEYGDGTGGYDIIDMGSGDRIIISFDELGEERSYMRYELIHCNAAWVPEGLVDSEFLDGFNQADVTDYEFSQATGVHYVNYRIEIPNQEMAPMLSGNYLLRVYPENEPDVTLLQARFSVSEGNANVKADLTSRTDFDYNDAHQQLTVEVDASRLRVNDYFNDIKIVVEQDGRTDNAVMITTPRQALGNKLVYEHNRELIFPAGNEYRRFEIVNEQIPGIGVESIGYAYPFYHYELYTDYPRNDGRYQYDLSLGGRYKVRRQNNDDDSDIAADYGIVHFSLEMPELEDYDVYIEGDLTSRSMSPESLMTYNRDAQRYEKALMLKQGAYSYQYIAVPKNSKNNVSHTEAIEGDYYPTGHRYTIKVYYREPGTRYDRLAGYLYLQPVG